MIGDIPNVREYAPLELGLAIPFFGRRLEPQEGLYLHEVQELSDELMKVTMWVGLPTHQQAFPVTITEG